MSRQHSKQKSFTVCIVAPSYDAYSETFVQAHWQHLPCRKKFLYGGWFPRYIYPRERLVKQNMFSAIRLVFKKSAFLKEQKSLEKKALTSFLRQEHVNVVLAEYGLTGIEVVDSCVNANIPLVVHFHGFDAFRDDILASHGKQYRMLFDRAAAFVAVSRDMESQLLRLGAPKKKVCYIPCGVEVNVFKKSSRTTTKPVFLFVGRFVPKKDPLMLLQSFSSLLSYCPEAKLMMIGDGILWKEAKRKAKALGIRHRVDFLGALSHQQVARHMVEARALVLPSRKSANGDCEGTPVVILEAGASGLPVVGTKHGGIKDVILHGKTGFLVDEGDCEGLSMHMRTLAEDAGKAERLGREGRMRIEQCFAMEKTIQALFDVLVEASGVHK